ncbi:outer membrane transport energization protein ExbB [Variovorax beijingensis]|uniref:Biopolymer transport protein ExbB n=1 Tax=Variovorax beijingensis TaxID=2496117 RepID=A0A561C346_9BURK|nr:MULTISPECIES: MotA/TolQ/ExbB proton channel family protein [Variovorax]MBD9667874.1 MotA/TolQ/ExbB proton channel family protein [Variovorax sp. VRV01]MDP9964437.1 biopolymer transport protein ExbB [Variovorax paradoxus]TWD85619.1 outer membrane transport energization protein ExbB [Variovorax beijingensis]
MTKTFLARLAAVAAPFVLAFGLGSAPQIAGAQTPPAPQAAASAAAAPAPVAVPEKPAAAPSAAAKMDNPYGVGALWSQSDAVAKAVLAILAIMSMGSWYVIVTKLLEQMRMGRQARAVDNEFWNAGTVQAGTARLAEGSPFRFIADAGMQATQKHDGLRGKVDFADFVDLCIHRATERVQRRLSNGMSLLATVGSTAPFVGLFGTVWGIYHALTAIGVAGQASIDKVAGPVGEALIMTAIGLAVAVPAVLGYNWLLRRNITVMDDVREFSGELHSVILAGSAAV